MKLREDEALIVAPDGTRYRIVGFKATVSETEQHKPFLLLMSTNNTSSHCVLLREIKRDENGRTIHTSDEFADSHTEEEEHDCQVGG